MVYSMLQYTDLTKVFLTFTVYMVGSKSFRPDVQKPHQMENAARDI